MCDVGLAFLSMVGGGGGGVGGEACAVVAWARLASHDSVTVALGSLVDGDF